MRTSILAALLLSLVACSAADGTSQDEEDTAVDSQALVSTELIRVGLALRGRYDLTSLPHHDGSGDITLTNGTFVSTLVTTTFGEALSAQGRVKLSSRSVAGKRIVLASFSYSLGMDGLIPEGTYRVNLLDDAIELQNVSVTPGLSGERPSGLYAGKRWTLRRPACGTRALPACAEGYFCKHRSAPMGMEFQSLTCGRADIAGTCQPVPTACPPSDARVCACDGRVYLNACQAALQGHSVDFAFNIQAGAPDHAKPPIGMECSRDM